MPSATKSPDGIFPYSNRIQSSTEKQHPSYYSTRNKTRLPPLMKRKKESNALIHCPDINRLVSYVLEQFIRF